ncbi:NotI family restriction endonuclease [Stenotrophomonas maltophilia]|uniref:NotI family restriction endonuclease n=1 Tax=Stenotrophomonas maltophilia TaxID=40324 RepID=UPI000DA3D983|nr:NotI family restriction endonuclease [Stenotrophomonas maltophilia]SQG08965.1 Restriction endonuclease NotI [Stenotrophomonas maltophilia]
MATNIVEIFGYSPSDKSAIASRARNDLFCPFISRRCQKNLRDGTPSGVCTLKPATTPAVICCPYRLYGDDYKILAQTAERAFKCKVQLFNGSDAQAAVATPGLRKVAVFGKGWGKELRLPNRGKSGGYFVDWILALLDCDGNLEEFIAVEVQSIDTTGNYQEERSAAIAGVKFEGKSTAGFNWENVNKRILPQLIYKGHALRQEPLCKKGLFFISPKPVYDKIKERLGGELRKYPHHPGSLTFDWYDLGAPTASGVTRALDFVDTFTTTVDQVALAFTAPSNLPSAGVYEEAIRYILD